MADAVPSEAPVGSPENYYGNAFYAKRTKFSKVGESATDYDGTTSRTWDICNTNKLHPYSGKPVSYKLVSRETAKLLPKEGSLVWKRASFARHTVHVTKCEPPHPPATDLITNCRTDRDDELWPAGRHVPQTSGEPSYGLGEWMGDGSESIDNTNVVLWHTFGVTHIPAPEDFPVMPAEPITLLLRPRNFFANNPAMDVPPSYATMPSQIAAKGAAVIDATDRLSKLAFANGDACCKNGTNGSS